MAEAPEQKAGPAVGVWRGSSGAGRLNLAAGAVLRAGVDTFIGHLSQLTPLFGYCGANPGTKFSHTGAAEPRYDVLDKPSDPRKYH